MAAFWLPRILAWVLAGIHVFRLGFAKRLQEYANG
jgi:hypothetical protein